MLSVIAALFVIFLGVVFLWKREEQEDPSTKTTIPGLKKNSKEIFDLDDISGQIVFLQDLHKRFGPIASFWQGDTFTVSISAPELLKETRSISEMPILINEFLRELLGEDNLSFQTTEEAIRRRKLYDQYFIMKACKTHFNVLKECAEEYVEKWRNNTENDHIPFLDTMNTAAPKAVLRVTFGETFANEEKFNSFKKELQLVFNGFVDVSEPNSPESEALSNAIKKLKEAVQEAFQERRKELQNGSETNIFIDVLLDDNISESQRSSDSLGYFISSGTIDLFLTMLMYNVIVKPELQEKLYEELKTVLGDDSVTLENFSKLPYLRQVIDETLRFYNILYTARIAEKDMTLGGHSIPKGTNIFQFVGGCHKDPAVWENPNDFDPEHFNQENIKCRHAFSYKPFGFAGRRICPGMSFSYMLMTIFTAVWLQKFKFALVPEQTVVFTKPPFTRIDKELMLTVTPRN